MTRVEIQLVKSLGDKQGRSGTGLFIAEGEKLVRELLESDFVVRTVYYTGETGFAECESMKVISSAAGVRVSVSEMERISRLKTPSGCLALVEIPHWKFDAASLKGRLTIALDEVQNPGNVGTIIRLADWFGVSDLLCSENCADCFNPKVIQATMGAITRVRVHYGDLRKMLSEAAAQNLPVYGTFLEGENIYKTQLEPQGVLVLGNEGKGISAEIGALVSRKLFIPPYPVASADGNTRAESLNVAIAGAIAVAEFRRREI